MRIRSAVSSPTRFPTLANWLRRRAVLLILLAGWAALAGLTLGAMAQADGDAAVRFTIDGQVCHTEGAAKPLDTIARKPRGN